ncbi:sigma factor-like helix-turn-helix DNA-binding protein [Streptomyces olivaceoviridis]|uniref:sigma factor-like helix-turn-helix DNA-binding protein n=1 Tax=Streptomyces olivaceoviridis TaxID=1921 RepID=UPI0036A6965E
MPERRGHRLDLPEADIVSAYASGSTLQELAEQYGVVAATIRNVLIRAGIERRHNTSLPPTPRRVDVPEGNLVQDYLGGATLGDLAEKYGVSVSTVQRRLRAAGATRAETTASAAPRPPRPKRVDLPDEELRIRFLRGTTLKVLAEEYGVSVSTISRHVERASAKLTEGDRTER